MLTLCPQSDVEKLEGLPVTPFMDRDKVTKPSSQTGFIRFVLLPLFIELANLFPCLEVISLNSIQTKFHGAKGFYGFGHVMYVLILLPFCSNTLLTQCGRLLTTTQRWRKPWRGRNRTEFTARMAPRARRRLWAHKAQQTATQRLGPTPRNQTHSDHLKLV